MHFRSVIAFLSFSGRLGIALVIGVRASCLFLYVCMCASVSFNSFIFASLRSYNIAFTSSRRFSRLAVIAFKLPGMLHQSD